MHSTVKMLIPLMIHVVMVSSDTASECSLAGFYQELGCTPAPSDNATEVGCAVAFTCPNLHPDPTKCFYRGVPYADQASLPDSVVMNSCSQACSCSVNNGQPRFECAAVDCVETFDTDTEQQCISTYEIDSCCSTGTVCGKDAIMNLKTCEYNGQTYKEGETFEPKNTHKSCVCTSEWDGQLENRTYCKDVNCGFEIHYQYEILENCAPVFVGNDRGCPISFQCPSPTTKVIRGLNLRNNNLQCTFGNVTLAVGDELSVDEKCTKCTCKVPPFVSCSMQNTCD